MVSPVDLNSRRVERNEVVMQQHRRAWVLVAGLSLFAVLLVGAVSAYGLRAHAAAVPSAAAVSSQDGRPDQDVVNSYFQILNAGMKSGDFSALATVYTPDATLTQSTPKGVTTVYNGIDAIIAWYKVFQSKFQDMQFTQDPQHPLRNLAPHVLLTYESAAPVGYHAPGRCMHVFTLKGGMIETLDWATFFGGTP
jgi:hypothetical protein